MQVRNLVILQLLAIALAGAAAAEAAPRREASSLRLSGGREVTLNLRLPAETRPGERLPALMIFGGFQQAAKVLELIESDERVALASFDYPFDPPRRFSFPSSLGLLPDAKRMLHWTREGVARAVEHLRSRPGIDPDRISILGASLGAPFALLGASDSPEGIRGVIVIHGFGDVPRTISHQFQRSWEKRFGAWSAPLAWFLGRFAWSYADLPSPEESARGLLHRQMLLVISAEKDSFVPAEAVESLRKAAKESGAGEVTLLETPGDHLQPGKKKLLSELLGTVVEWMKARALL